MLALLFYKIHHGDIEKIVTVKRVVALLITAFVILFTVHNMNPVGIILQKRKSRQSE